MFIHYSTYRPFTAAYLKYKQTNMKNLQTVLTFILLTVISLSTAIAQKNNGTNQQSKADMNFPIVFKKPFTKKKPNYSVLQIEKVETNQNRYQANADATRSHPASRFAKGAGIGAAVGLIGGVVIGAAQLDGDNLLDVLLAPAVVSISGVLGAGAGAVVGGMIGLTSGGPKASIPLSPKPSSKKQQEKKLQDINTMF